MAPARVLFHFPYTRELTGGPRTLLQLIGALDPRIVVPSVVLAGECELADAVRARGVETILLRPPALLDRYGGEVLRTTFLGKLRVWKALERYRADFTALFRETGAEAVWNRGLRAVLSTLPAARRVDIPCIWDIGIEEGRGRIVRVLRRRALCGVDAVVTQSACQPAEIFGAAAARRRAARFYPNPPGLAADRAREIEEIYARRPLEPDPVIACIGTLAPRKNQAMLIRALGRIAGRFPEFRLQLVGASESEAYRSSLLELARKLGIGERVELTGWRDDAAEILARSALLAVPSRNEGIPHVVREAMLLGVPVIATAVGGIPDIVRPSVNGQLVAPNDDKAFAAAISRVLSEPAVRRELARGARTTGLALSHDAWAARYNEIFVEVLRTRSTHTA